MTRPGARRPATGFTLIELLVAVAILAVLAALAAPSFNEAILSNRLASYANEFTAATQLVRAEAIKRNAIVTMCRSDDGAVCASTGTWAQGWIAMCLQKPEKPSICDPDGTESLVVYRHAALGADYRLSDDPVEPVYSIEFLGSGLARKSGTAQPLSVVLILCRATPEPGGQARKLRMNAAGRVSVEKTVTSVCN